MRLSVMIAAVTAAGLGSSVLGGYTITQGDSQAAVAGQSITFEEAGVPTGVNINPFTFYLDSDGVSFGFGDGQPAVVDQWDTNLGAFGGGQGGNSMLGQFSVRMLFAGDITEIDFQGVADGSPGPPFGGINVILINDGDEANPVATYSGIAPFGTTVGSWFHAVATDGDVFDEVRFFNGSFQTFNTVVDNLTFTPPLVPVELSLDIKPGSCPNSVNRNSRGVFPVALLGTMDFDIEQVDVDSIVLGRADGVGGTIAPARTHYKDVATPFEGEGCGCNEFGGDDFMDLTLKFRTHEVVEALELDGDLPGAMVELCLSGTLLDGTPFFACDCIRLVPPTSAQNLLLRTSVRGTASDG